MLLISLFFLLMTLVITPLLLTLRTTSQRETEELVLTTGLVSVALCLVVAVVLHIADIPITTSSLRLAHAGLFVMALFCYRWPQHLPMPVCSRDRRDAGTRSAMQTPSCTDAGRHRAYEPGFFFVILLALLVFPYTHLAGIDTYKWQDLATSVRMEASLPWVVHPLSLFGFTPRAYPSAHPVLLATVQLSGKLGVDAGFFVVSLLTACLGLASATRLANLLFPRKTALLTGLLYVLSPVFIRYTHWATGRGLFLAIFPVFIALLIAPLHGDHSPAPGKRRAWTVMLRRSVGIMMVALLLLLSHKVAIIAVPLFLLCRLPSLMVPARQWPYRFVLTSRLVILLAMFMVAAALVSPVLLPGPAGVLAGLTRTSVMRFGWMLPLMLLGIADMPSGSSWKRILPAALIAIPLAFDRQMYGALYALPFVCVFAVAGAEHIGGRLPPGWYRRGMAMLAATALLGAVASVVARSQKACSPALYRAAMALEAHDPHGPFRVHAPGTARTRIQAYVSGCPRFQVQAHGAARVQWPRFPPPQRNLRHTLETWGTSIRHLLSLSDTEISWYGKPEHHYYFIIDNQGDTPANGILIYEREGIAIYKQIPLARFNLLRR